MIRLAALATGAAILFLLFAIAGEGMAALHPLVLFPTLVVPSGVIVAAAAVTGAGVAWAAFAYGQPVEGRRRIGYAAALPVVALGGALLLAASVPNLSASRAAAALLLSALALFAGVRCVERLAAGETIGFESHWGGLGGGSGGWRLLPAASLAALALIFAGGALAVLVAEPSQAPAAQGNGKEQKAGKAVARSAPRNPSNSPAASNVAGPEGGEAANADTAP